MNLLRISTLSLLFLMFSLNPLAADDKGQSRFRTLEGGVVLDTKTNLMWAAEDNGKDIDWQDAKYYCINYQGGGYTDWRLPTQDELAELYTAGIRCNKDHPIKLTSYRPWASEIRGSKAAYFYFRNGDKYWLPPSFCNLHRALPVRSGK